MPDLSLSGAPANTADRVFIVRLWLERQGKTGEDSVWRGKVTNLHSARETYVSSLAQALNVIREAMNMPPHETSGDGRDK